MIRLILICSFLVVAFRGNAQQKCPQPIEVSAYSADSLLEHSLQDYFNKGYFNQLLKKLKIKKISCSSGCDAVWAELVFSVDPKGKIVPVRIRDYNCCDRPQSNFIQYFYDSLKGLTVPVAFAGKCYVYRFGRVLKC